MYASPKISKKESKTNDNATSVKLGIKENSVKENKNSSKLESYQLKADLHAKNSSLEAIQLKSERNNTGLPDNIKNGVENLSGQSLNDVKVHFNSDKPAQMKAHAYAEGNQIHVAGGQEKHLAHEAWHVVQQKENRVSPTTKINGLNVNTDKSLEKEADVMGAKASSLGSDFEESSLQLKSKNISSSASIQGYFESGYRDKENTKSFSEPVVQRNEKGNEGEQDTTTEQDTSEEQSSFVERSKEVLNGMIESITSAGEAAFKGLSSAGNSLVDILSQMGNAAAGALSDLASRANKMITTVKEYSATLSEIVGLDIKEADKKREKETAEFKAKYPKSALFLEVCGAIAQKIVSLVPIVGPLLALHKQVRQGFRRFADWNIFSKAEDQATSSVNGGLNDALKFAVGKAWRGFQSAAMDIGYSAVSLSADIAALFSAGAAKVLDFGNKLVKVGFALYSKARGLGKLFTGYLHKNRNKAVDEIVNAAKNPKSPDHKIAVEILQKLGSGSPKNGWITQQNKDSGIYASMDSKSGGKKTFAQDGMDKITEGSGILSDLDNMGMAGKVPPTVVNASDVFEATEKRIEEDSLEAMKNA